MVTPDSNGWPGSCRIDGDSQGRAADHRAKQVSERVYKAVGFDVADATFVVGKDGLVVAYLAGTALEERWPAPRSRSTATGKP